ncbi:hypothetical protein RclHR1_00280034 [Rhizophagus clarus]|uniref:Zinc finger MYND domain-containing protein 10 n=1 Tax=Rhizophagus clarus TaxID=94130 RepID=A0A2Z6R700_9GLOM|nr:hypothetical protein RclHR1_00280034 [Rhizophagus clarus]GES83758.1 zinc finger MYND domain-containing protein 10 [Rhizophagus clarus]
MNECYVCKKSSKTRCNKCHTTYYCSIECQKKDWKEHKKPCRILSINKIFDETVDEESFDNMLHQLLMNANYSMEDLKIPNFGEEYAMKYSHEKEQIQFLNRAKLSLNGH